MTAYVREMHASDRAVWTNLRCALWPDESLPTHASSIQQILSSDDAWGFLAETSDRVPAGFAELAIRKYANGCETQPVPFLEGLWVAPRFRRQGIGRCLIRYVEAFVMARGYRELGSDTEIDNLASQSAHLAWGFSETERVVYFRKSLQPDRS
jgi:aminoglycoside 6'-N-acetyltransferase I